MSRPSTPAASARACPRWPLARSAASAACLRARGRHDHHAVVSATTTSPGCTSAPAQTTGTLTEPSVALTCPWNADRAAEHGEAHLVEVTLHVAHAAVDHQARAAARLERSGQQVAEEAVGVVAGAGGDDDVAGLDLLGRDMQHPVVAGLQQHGDCRAAEARAGVDGPDARLHQAHAAQRLMHGGDAEARELFDGGRIGAHDVAMDDAELLWKGVVRHGQRPLARVRDRGAG
jgi:hypothetical protein